MTIIFKEKGKLEIFDGASDLLYCAISLYYAYTVPEKANDRQW